ncbi:MAG: beta-ketoacyl-[acyl-carrier-protein] synthase family protein [Candidatus Omnitrophica bacterium]|nr:beta-ketoacyl-[acyl-carrier-protein] synthase family protein [Candidatus Omnitrophota bacterium]
MMTPRVVVTGMGIVSPIGIGLTAFRKSLKEGISGEGPIQTFDPSAFPFKRAFEVKHFDARSHGTHILDPFIQYAIAAAGEAIQNAEFEPEQTDAYRIGISVSSSKGGVHTLDRFKERFIKHPSAILGARIYCNAVPNFAAQWIARRWKIHGPAKCYIAACATGTVAVIEGARMIQEGVVDYCIAGASDASIVPLLLAGYHKMKTLSRDSIRPFDKSRSGFLIGEGAGIVFLETLESARARRAKIFGEILGSSYASDGTHALRFKEEENALSRALKELLDKTQLDVSALDYVNLHGTGTKEGDLYETRQLKKALGKQAYHIPMSSIKSMTGHMLGASGAVEVIATLLAMEEGFVPPTMNLLNPDPACDLDYTPQRARPKKISHAISHSMGFGGHVAALALGKV